MPRLGRCWAEPRKRNGLWSLHFPELSRQALRRAASHFMLIHSHLGLCSSVCVRESGRWWWEHGAGSGWAGSQCAANSPGKSEAEMPSHVLPERRWASGIFLRAQKSSSENFFLSQTFRRYFLSVRAMLVPGHRRGWDRHPSPWLFHLYHPTVFPCWILYQMCFVSFSAKMIL